VTSPPDDAAPVVGDPVAPGAPTRHRAPENRPPENGAPVKPERVRMTGQQRREQLLEVGRRLFAEKGFEAVTVEEIAAKAGVSKPVVYEHFGGKEGLYAVVVDREMNTLLRMITDALTAGHPRELLEQAGLALFAYIEGSTDGFRVLVRDSPVSQQTGNFAAQGGTNGHYLLALPDAGVVVGAFPDQIVEPLPVLWCDRFAPTVEIAHNNADAPPTARVLDEPQVGQRLPDALVSLLLGGPIGKLGEPRAAGATGRVKVAHHHVIEQDIVQAARTQARAAKVRVDIQDRQFGQSLF